MSYRIIEILDSVLGIRKQFAKSEYYYYCPFCNHYKPKLAVNLNKRKWHCWKCDARGSTLLSLLRKLNVTHDQINELAGILEDELPRYKHDVSTEGTLTLPAEYRSLYGDCDTFTAMHARAYLSRRGFSEDDIIKYQIGYCEMGHYENRVIVPSYDETGKLNFFVGRDIYNSGMAYKNPPVSKNIIGFENIINWNHPIVLTEGVFDAMAIKRNAIPLFGKSVPNVLRKKIIQEEVKQIYLALDNDAMRDTLRIAEKFSQEGIDVFIVETKEKDPAQIGFDSIHKLIRSAKTINFIDLMHFKMKLT